MGLFTKRENGKLKFLWGFKQKAIAGALALVMVLAVGVVLVIAATSQNTRFQTRVSFSATDVAADIYMKTTHVGGNTGATDIDVNMSGNIASVDSGDTNYGVYSYKTQILPNTQADSINVTATSQNLVEMGTTKTLPDSTTTYTSFVKYEFKVVNNSSKNLGVRFTYYFNDNGNKGATYNNVTLGFKAQDNTGTASANIANGIDILAAGNTSSKYGTSSGYATFVLWVKVVNQALNADTSNIVINISLYGADEVNAYDGTDLYDINNDGMINERDAAIMYVYAVRGEVIPANTDFTYGDIDGNGSRNILDVTAITNYLGNGHCSNLRQLALMDMDCNFIVNEDDRALLEIYLYTSFPASVPTMMNCTLTDIVMIDKLVVRESVAVTDALLARYDLDGSNSLDMNDYMLVHAYYTHGVEIASAPTRLFGDVYNDGSVNAMDSATITNRINFSDFLSAVERAISDIDFNGKIEEADATALTSYLSDSTQYLQNIKDALIS